MPTDIVKFRRGWMSHKSFANDYEKLVYAYLTEQAALFAVAKNIGGENATPERPRPLRR